MTENDAVPESNDEEEGQHHPVGVYRALAVPRTGMTSLPFRFAKYVFAETLQSSSAGACHILSSLGCKSGGSALFCTHTLSPSLNCRDGCFLRNTWYSRAFRSTNFVG